MAFLLMTKRQFSAGWLTGLLTLAVAACAGGDDTVAHLRQPRGEVTVGKSQTKVRKKGEHQAPLQIDDVVSTGADSEVAVVFLGGNVVALGPESSLVLQEEGGTTLRVGAVLLTGTATATSIVGSDYRVSLGTAFGLVQLGALAATVQVGADGLSVLIGQVEVVGSDGSARTVDAGSILTLDGLVVPINEDEVVTLEPLRIVLLASSKQVQIKRVDSDKWVAPDKRDVLNRGDAVRTRRAATTRLQIGEQGAVELGSETQLVLEEGGRAADGAERASFRLAGGTANVELNREEGREVAQEILIGEAGVRVEPGLERASVEVSAGKNERARVTVRAGKATLADGTVVGPGETASVVAGKLDGAVRPLEATEVRLAPKSNAVVYYSQALPSLAFDWSEAMSEAAPYEIEISRDKDHQQPVYRELVQGKQLVFDRAAPGRLYWRVRPKDGQWQEGAVLLSRSEGAGAVDIKRKNDVFDTGEKTTVLFQQSLPAITMHWKPVPAAKSYRLKVFVDGDFETPMVDQTVSDGMSHAFKAGAFREGKYFWLVSALDAQGKELATGRTNNLEVSYDNWVTDLVIRSPKQNGRVSGKVLTTTGDVQLGARLYINGKRARTDAKGRFNEQVPLQSGTNDLVYRTVAKGVDRYYVLQVHRR